MPNFLHLKALSVTTAELTIILIATAVIFIVLIIVAIIRTYRLNAENKKLMDTNAFRDAEESSKDFTNGHLYGDN